ncbi:MAG: hypothetical protein A2Z93_10885 [Curvibacter sp. GWA2_64_110]|nr:MAG: hypothetical protein A2Z93_10885 [Curvibacter sp. GWA2_64_110]HCY16090.1 hypothetical protein [Curvibacter sp.]
MKDIDSCLNSVELQGAVGSAATQQHLPDPLSLSRLSTACIGLLALSLHTKEEEQQLFRADWLSESKLPNPNHILQCMLTQLANFSLSASVLLERGLDNPARALCRHTMELSQQILALMYSRDDFRIYIGGHDEKSSTHIWNALFAKGKLNRRLSEIEERLGFDAEMVDHMRAHRSSNYAFYSQAVHHSYIATTVGSYSPRFDGSWHSLGVFGGENAAVETTFRSLNFTLWYFLLVFFAILDKHHRIRPRNAKELFWLEAFMLHFCVKEGYLLLYTGTDNPIESSATHTSGAPAN